MIASAPATSASGAAAPICAASAEGMRKMPPPTITLITAAVSANEPTARSSAASPCRGAADGGRAASFIGGNLAELAQSRMSAPVAPSAAGCRCSTAALRPDRSRCTTVSPRAAQVARQFGLSIGTFLARSARCVVLRFCLYRACSSRCARSTSTPRARNVLKSPPRPRPCRRKWSRGGATSISTRSCPIASSAPRRRSPNTCAHSG